jgi:hypothetical protein
MNAIVQSLELPLSIELLGRGTATKNVLDLLGLSTHEYHIIITIADRDRTALNTVGSPCLAKGGSGDALCGILSACLWEMKDPFESTRCACLRMGDAAVRAQNVSGDRGVLTADWLQYLK